MCGISGFIQFSPAREETLRAAARKMADALVHRGPDDAGEWVEPRAGIALSHRRLSVVDLSPEGRQPMVSADENYVITYNGEIYNFEEIRKELDAGNLARAWRGHSDTEVLLAAVSAWGLDATLSKLVGMFAFVLWDRSTQSLHLVRDRMGEKPIYYGWARDAFVFASELKAIRAYPASDARIDREALALYMRFGCVPSPYSIYRGIWKLPAATHLTLSPPDISARNLPTPRPYWSLRDVVTKGRQAPFGGTATEAADALDAVLRSAVAGQMVADVPLGAFLSGGIDSSTIVALMQSQSSRPIRTFSIGFQEADYNEAEQARAVARHLHTDHVDLYLTPKDALAVVPKLPFIFDEPFADASQIPTYLLARLARQHVTVSLSGDGGDELFGGYSRYAWGAEFDTRLGRLPVTLRRFASLGITLFRPSAWDAAFKVGAPVLPRALRQRLPGNKLHKLAAALPYESRQDLYDRLVSHWYGAEMVLGEREATRKCWNDARDLGLDVAGEMMAADLLGYLPDDILVKVDRAAMAVSLETRAPLLDHRVVEFAWSLPSHLKIRGTKGKEVLRATLARYVPPSLTERAKMGFAVPLDAWLRGPLRHWAEDLLGQERLAREGLLSEGPIRKRWDQHQNGSHNWQQSLWTVLMFQAWLEAQRL